MRSAMLVLRFRRALYLCLCSVLWLVFQGCSSSESSRENATERDTGKQTRRRTSASNAGSGGSKGSAGSKSSQRRPEDAGQDAGEPDAGARDAGENADASAPDGGDADASVDASTAAATSGPEPAALGRPCGGMVYCREGLFCNLDTSAGGKGCMDAETTAGVCATMPTSCPGDYVPLCGCNRRTYGTPCNAQMNGQSKLHDGECDQTDCKAVGGHLVLPKDKMTAATCPDGESEHTVSVDTSGADEISGAVCCTPG